MGKTVIKCDGLGKRYRIGGAVEKFPTLRDAVVAAVKRPIERIRHPGAVSHRTEDLWALKDVCLDVCQGDVLAVIGTNGAGKSTLLKVLCRITEPTTGYAELDGRVGSLLEVGTGFHPELTGRENIFLNGAILGMSRVEIARKFDEIVAFAEMERFLETPVKRYSSGMYVRLAFAVAAHLESEILLIDEVLSVGDVGFQKRCLSKMEDVAGTGRTVLFVSHNMQAVRRLCTRAIHLEGGQVVAAGSVGEVVDDYLEHQASARGERTWGPGEGPGDDHARLVSVSVLDTDGKPCAVVNTSDPFVVRMEFDVESLDAGLSIGFDLTASDGTLVTRAYQTDLPAAQWPQVRQGRNAFECTFPGCMLNEGRYMVVPRIQVRYVGMVLRDQHAVAFEAHLDHSLSRFTELMRPGLVSPRLEWRALSSDG